MKNQMNRKLIREKGAVLRHLPVLGIVLLTVGLFLNAWNSPAAYSLYENDSIRYESAEVIRISDESLELMEGSSDWYLGTQTVTVKRKNGEELEILNNLSTTHSIKAAVGMRVIVKVDAPENVTPYYSIYNYDRSVGIGAIVLVFAVLIILVGKKKGLRSLVGLVFSLALICCVLLPAIYRGYSPILCTLGVASAAAAVSMLLLNGFSAKTVSAFLATVSGTVAAVGAFALFCAILKISGYHLEEAEALMLASQHTGLKLGQVLFSGVIIASLGAVMDMTMSVTAGLWEIQQRNLSMSRREIFMTGMEMGQDMIGTMTQTLILAFVGSAMSMLLVLMAYGVSFNQLLSSDYIAIELIHSVTGSIAVVATVPLSAAFVMLFGRRGRAADISF